MQVRSTESCSSGERQTSPFRTASILVCSPISAYGGFNTSAHRVSAFCSLGHDVHAVDSTIKDGFGRVLVRRVRRRLFQMGLRVSLPATPDVHDELCLALRAQRWDVLWLEHYLDTSPEILAKLKELAPHTVITGFSPDDINARHNQSQAFLQAIGMYDAFVTTKSFNVAELARLGCRRPIFVDNGYDPEAFQPIPLAPADAANLGGEVGFIGTYETERARQMVAIANHGLRVRVWGNGWNRVRRAPSAMRLELRPLYGPEYAKACRAFKINLCFLRKINRDQQTTRSVEIPACGGFMLAERTPEHQYLFREGIEAEFFESDDELLDKCRYYLRNDASREGIARHGYERCISGGYSNAARLAPVIESLLRDGNRTAGSIGIDGRWR